MTESALIFAIALTLVVVLTVLAVMHNVTMKRLHTMQFTPTTSPDGHQVYQIKPADTAPEEKFKCQIQRKKTRMLLIMRDLTREHLRNKQEMYHRITMSHEAADGALYQKEKPHVHREKTELMAEIKCCKDRLKQIEDEICNREPREQAA